MLSRKTLLLFVGTAVFVTGVYFLDRESPQSDSQSQFATEKIVQVQIHRSVHPEKEINLKLDHSWEITKPIEDLADPNKITEIFEFLKDVYNEKISSPEMDLKFSPPAILLQTTTSDGSTNEFAFSLENNYQGKAYVKTADSKGKSNVYLVDGELKKVLLQDVNFYREKRILPQGFGLYNRFSFTNLLGHFELQKTTNGWISKPALFYADEKFDERKISAILKQITEYSIISDVDPKDRSQIDLKSQKVSLQFSLNQESWKYEIALDPKTLKVYGWQSGKNRLVIIDPVVWEQIAYLGLDDFRDRTQLLSFNKEELLNENNPAFNQLVDALHDLTIFRFLSVNEKKLMKVQDEFTLYKPNNEKMMVYRFGPTLNLFTKGVKESVSLIEVENFSHENLRTDKVGIRSLDVNKIKEILKKVRNKND